MLNQHFLAAAAVAIAISVAAAPAHGANWLQFGGDAAHGSFNRVEHGYSTAQGNRVVFSSVALPSAVDAAPVFVEQVLTPGGVRDLLIAVAKDGTVLALDVRDGSIVWTARPAGLGTLTTGSPAIDLLCTYVYAYGMDGKIHKYNIANGSETVDAAWPQIATLKPDIEKNAAALTIAMAANGHNYLYAVSNSYFDAGDFQGHLTAIDLDSGTQNVFNAQCSDLGMHFVANGVTAGPAQNDCAIVQSPRPNQTAGSGIWGRAGAVFDAGMDRVYVATGNGAFDPGNASGNGRDWGDSVLALNPDGSGSFVAGMPLDSYTPDTYANLLITDADLGSTSPAMLPAPAGSSVAHLAMQGGKDGCVRLLDLERMSGSSGAGHVGGELQATNLPGTANHCMDGGNLGTFKAQAAVWVNPRDASTWVFVGHAAGMVAYRVEIDEDGTPSLEAQWSSNNAGTSPVIANGTLYYVASGAVRALDAETGNQIWVDNRIGGIHWQSPIVVNGRLYVFDESGLLWTFQLDGIFRGAFE